MARENNIKSIFIFRRDLRIEDNLGLIECYRNSIEIFLVFIFNDERIRDTNNSKAMKFLVDSLQDLNERTDGKISFYMGEDTEVLEQILINNPGINSIYENLDYSPFAARRSITCLLYTSG